MRFIHTSDWHLGKTISGNSRLKEQEQFCEEFIDIVNQNNIDMVIIAGDVFDDYEPSLGALKLFYDTVSKLANNGSRCVIIIPGDHDNIDRLTIANSLYKEQGIIILNNKSIIDNETKYCGYSVVNYSDGCINLSINNESVNIIDLSDMYNKDNTTKESSVSGSLEDKFKADSINIAVGHICINESKTTSSERNSKISGCPVIDKKDLPNKAQYIALGHLHNAQKVSQNVNAYYSGSPIQYSKEDNDKKSVYIVDIDANSNLNMSQIYLTSYKPIEVFICRGVKDAIRKCEENKDRDIWSYFEIKTNETIESKDIIRMRQILKDIIEIKPVIVSYDYEDYKAEIEEKSIGRLFDSFYKLNNNCEPKGELIDLFLDILSDEGDMQNETN